MAIIVVNEIPKPNRPQKVEPFDYRGKTRADLEQAWNERIHLFEFVGYNNSASTLQFAKDEANKMVYEKLYIPAKKIITEILQKELKKKLGGAIKYFKVKPYIRAYPTIIFTGVTVSGVKRIFCEFNWGNIDHYTDGLLEQTRKIYSDKETIVELKARYEREKFLKKARRGKI